MTSVLSDVEPPPNDPRDRRALVRSGLLSFGEAPGAWQGGLGAARRHTALVRVLRAAAIGVCLIGIGLVAAGAFFTRTGPLPGVLSAAKVGFDGSRITLESPKISGFQNDRRPYSLSARVGVQDLSTPQVIELLDIDAGIGTADDKTMRVTAARASYDSASEQVLLDGNVSIASTSGYDLSLQRARVDFKAGTLVSDAPVSLRLDGADVRGGRMTIDDKRHVISFDGGVRSSIQSGVAREAGLGTPPGSAR